MTTRTTIPGSPVPTLSAPGAQPVPPYQETASVPPRTRYYAAPDVDPTLFARQIPYGPVSYTHLTLPTNVNV